MTINETDGDATQRDAFIAVDTNLCCTHANGEAAALLHAGLDEMRGRPLWDLLAAILDAPTRDSWRSALEKQPQAPMDLGEHRAQDGRRFACRCFPAPGGMCIHLVDSTRLERALEAIDEEHRHVDRFLAMIAHELRGPLAMLPHALQLLRAAQEPEDRERTLDSAERQVAYMATIIADLHDASSIMRGRVELHTSSVNLAELIAAVLGDMEEAVQRKRHRIQLRLPPEIAVWGDWMRLCQVFRNLLGNAVSYTDSGGEIVISATETEGEAEIRVRDSGRGILPELLSHIFSASYDYAGSISGGSSLGIGLRVVRRIVELHGGAVTARSDGLGRGSEFKVRLPRAKSLPSA
ncbi:MAG TPA: ATP-binding protein [Gammaproteobacteria bacterium]|nr:ATP-binding protein [Gammaproteobacteria bacterium]